MSTDGTQKVVADIEVKFTIMASPVRVELDAMEKENDLLERTFQIS